MTDDRTGEQVADGRSSLRDLAARLAERCNALGLHVATVESCTGGLVGHAITEIPGSSAYYVGGFVTYSDELKFLAVAVPHDVLSAHGAVSAQVAMAMATGGRQRTGGLGRGKILELPPRRDVQPIQPGVCSGRASRATGPPLAAAERRSPDHGRREPRPRRT